MKRTHPTKTTKQHPSRTPIGAAASSSQTQRNRVPPPPSLFSQALLRVCVRMGSDALLPIPLPPTNPFQHSAFVITPVTPPQPHPHPHSLPRACSKPVRAPSPPLHLPPSLCAAKQSSGTNKEREDTHAFSIASLSSDHGCLPPPPFPTPPTPPLSNPRYSLRLKRVAFPYPPSHSLLSVLLLTPKLPPKKTLPFCFVPSFRRTASPTSTAARKPPWRCSACVAPTSAVWYSVREPHPTGAWCCRRAGSWRWASSPAWNACASCAAAPQANASRRSCTSARPTRTPCGSSPSSALSASAATSGARFSPCRTLPLPPRCRRRCLCCRRRRCSSSTTCQRHLGCTITQALLRLRLLPRLRRCRCRSRCQLRCRRRRRQRRQPSCTPAEDSTCARLSTPTTRATRHRQQRRWRQRWRQQQQQCQRLSP